MAVMCRLSAPRACELITPILLDARGGDRPESSRLRASADCYHHHSFTVLTTRMSRAIAGRARAEEKSDEK